MVVFFTTFLEIIGDDFCFFDFFIYARGIILFTPLITWSYEMGLY
jgi:hypothetical protein